MSGLKFVFLFLFLLLRSVSAQCLQVQAQGAKLPSRAVTFDGTKKALLSSTVALATGQLTSLVLFASRQGIGRAEKLILHHGPVCKATAIALLSLAYCVQPDLSKGPATLITSPSSSSSSSSSFTSNFSPRRQLARWSQVAVGVSLKAPIALTGPAGEMGAAMSRAVSSFPIFRSLTSTEINALVVAGAAAGVASNLDLPLTGIFFALEVYGRMLPPDDDHDHYRKGHLNPKVIKPFLLSVLCAVSSLATTKYLRKTLGYGLAVSAHPFSAASYSTSNQLLREFPAFVVLGLATSLISLLYLQIRNSSAAAFQSLTFLPYQLRPVIGMIVLMLTVKKSGVSDFGLSGGIKILNELLQNSVESSFWDPAIISNRLISRVFVTGFCLASGILGGLVAPVLFMGSSLGALTRYANTRLFPTASLSSGSVYILAGGAAMLGITFRAPIMAMIMAYELTLSINSHVAPVVAISVLIAAKSIDWFDKHLFNLGTFKKGQSRRGFFGSPGVIPAAPVAFP